MNGASQSARVTPFPNRDDSAINRVSADGAPPRSRPCVISLPFHCVTLTVAVTKPRFALFVTRVAPLQTLGQRSTQQLSTALSTASVFAASSATTKTCQCLHCVRMVRVKHSSHRTRFSAVLRSLPEALSSAPARCTTGCTLCLDHHGCLHSLSRFYVHGLTMGIVLVAVGRNDARNFDAMVILSVVVLLHRASLPAQLQLCRTSMWFLSSTRIITISRSSRFVVIGPDWHLLLRCSWTIVSIFVSVDGSVQSTSSTSSTPAHCTTGCIPRISSWFFGYGFTIGVAILRHKWRYHGHCIGDFPA